MANTERLKTFFNTFSAEEVERKFTSGKATVKFFVTSELCQ